MSFIEVENLVKEYKIYESKPGVKGAIESLLHRKYRTKLAVNNISFKVNKSDIVGFIGPNGAGKSTTIKMLSGILVPTSGNITVGDINPYMERKKIRKELELFLVKDLSYIGIYRCMILLNYINECMIYLRKYLIKIINCIQRFLKWVTLLNNLLDN